jgi:hypothetical protein
MALNSKGNYFSIDCCHSYMVSCPKKSARVSYKEVYIPKLEKKLKRIPIGLDSSPNVLNRF